MSKRKKATENDAFTQMLAGLLQRPACPCCMGRGWVLARLGRTRCWVCQGRGR